jgi:hypothetical protein
MHCHSDSSPDDKGFDFIISTSQVAVSQFGASRPADAEGGLETQRVDPVPHVLLLAATSPHRTKMLSSGGRVESQGAPGEASIAAAVC